MVVVPRRSRLPCFDLLINRWRLWPQFRTILPPAVRPNRFFAPLFVLSLGIRTSVSGLRRRGTPHNAARRLFEPRYIATPPSERKPAKARETLSPRYSGREGRGNRSSCGLL